MLLGRFPGPPSRQDAELSRAARPTTYQFLAPSPFCALLHKMGTLQGQGLYLAPEAYSLGAEVQKTHGIVAPDPLFVQHADIPSSPEQGSQPATPCFFCAHKRKTFAQNGNASGAMAMGVRCVGARPHGRPSGVAVDSTEITKKLQQTQRFQAFWVICSPSELVP